ncbi:MAG: hypothetical protein ABIN44_06770 [Burkholderiaceae bacterium]
MLDTLNLGAQSSGMRSFNWPAGAYDASSGLTFRVTAMSGATTLSSTELMRDSVDAVSTTGDALMLELRKSGSTPYSTVKALN